MSLHRNLLPGGAIVFALLLVIESGCHEKYPTCFSGDWRACTCSGSDLGYQACRADGEDFERCVCDGSIPGLDAAKNEATTDAAPDVPDVIAGQHRDGSAERKDGAADGDATSEQDL